MLSRFTVALCFTAAVVLVAGCGSDPTGSGGSGAAQYSLGWGRNLADQVRDSELPDGLLFMISCIDVNDEGEPETGLPWQFYYADPADSSTILIVMVQYIGTTDHYWEDSTNVPVTELPDYDDAGPWVEVARDSMGTAYEDWEEYALIVKGNDYPEFPLITNVAVLQFMSPDTTEQATAIIDSDNDSFLGLITYP